MYATMLFMVRGSFDIPLTGHLLLKPVLHNTGYCFVCPRCGELWARVTLKGAVHAILSRNCSDCQPNYKYMLLLPGSLWLDYDPEFNDALPQPVLEREFWLHVNQYEKVNQNG